MLNTELIEKIKQQGGLKNAQVSKAEIGGLYLESVWMNDDGAKVVLASSVLEVELGDLLLRAESDVNLIISADGKKDVVVFTADPSEKSQHIWLTVFDGSCEENTDFYQTTLEILKIIPCLHPKEHQESLNQSGIATMDLYASQIESAFKALEPQEMTQNDH